MSDEPDHVIIPISTTQGRSYHIGRKVKETARGKNVYKSYCGQYSRVEEDVEEFNGLENKPPFGSWCKTDMKKIKKLTDEEDPSRAGSHLVP